MGASNSRPRPEFVPFRLDVDVPNVNDASWRSYWFSCSIDQRNKPRAEFERLFKQRVVKWRGYVYKAELKESKPRVLVKMNPTDSEGPDIMIQFPKGIDTGDPASYARWAPISFVVAIDEYNDKEGYLKTHAVTEQPSPASPMWEYFLRTYGSQARDATKSIFMLYFRGRQISWVGRITKAKQKRWFLRMDPQERASGSSDVQINIPDGILVPEKVKRGWWCRVNGVVSEMGSKKAPTLVVASQLAVARDPGQLATQHAAQPPVYETAKLKTQQQAASAQPHSPHAGHFAASPVAVEPGPAPSAPTDMSELTPEKVMKAARQLSRDDAVGEAVADAVRSLKTALRPVVDMVTVQLRNASVSAQVQAAASSNPASSRTTSVPRVAAGAGRVSTSRPLPAIPSASRKRALPPPPARRTTVASTAEYHAPTVVVGAPPTHEGVDGYLMHNHMVETPKRASVAMGEYPPTAPEADWAPAYQPQRMDEVGAYSDHEAARPRERKQSVNIYPGEFDDGHTMSAELLDTITTATDRLADIEANIEKRKRQRTVAPVSSAAVSSAAPASPASSTESSSSRATARAKKSAVAVEAPPPIEEEPAPMEEEAPQPSAAERELLERAERDARDIAKREAAMKVYMARLGDERRVEAERRRRAELDAIQMEQPVGELDEEAQIAAAVEKSIQESMAGRGPPRRQLTEEFSPEVPQEATSQLERIEAAQRARQARLATLRRPRPASPAAEPETESEDEAEETEESESEGAVLVAE